MRPSRYRRSRKLPIANINITPFVDVLLVLLVVFMVAAPALNVGVPVNLPKGTGQKVATDNQPLVITVKTNGSVFLGDVAMTAEQLDARLTQLAATNREKKIYVRGDKNASYGTIMAVMNNVAQKGLTRVSLITEGSSNGANK
ncbi:MAG: biopolymer transporter ExbD [Hydrotalea sp.]|nr:biopolymer transporter ExbD [Hydrotalea sp.]